MMLNESNYFSQESEQHFMGSTQFKRMMSCPARAMAMLRGDWREQPSTAMLVGSYCDSHFSGTMDLFRAQHPELLKRDGTLKSEYEQANTVIQRIEMDPMMMSFLSGQHQVIMTGEIAGVPFKIKIDSYDPNHFICDQKIMRSFEPIWSDELHCKQNFVESWGYDYQGSIYHAVEGNHLPFIIAGATKDDFPDIELFEIPQDILDDRLEIIEDLAPQFQMIKLGLEEPERCGRCPYCLSTKVLTGVRDYREVGL